MTLTTIPQSAVSTALLRTNAPHNALQGSKASKTPEHCQRHRFLTSTQTYGITAPRGETQKYVSTDA